MTIDEMSQVINKLKISENDLRKSYVLFCNPHNLGFVQEKLEQHKITMPVISDARLGIEDVFVVKDWELRSTIEFNVGKIGGDK